MAHRDEILAYAAELLDLDAWPDYGPMGMQVIGVEEVRKIVCAVSASRELFEHAAAAGAQLIVVHHGILLDRESRVIDARMKGRLQALFAADLTLAGYHLALDAHPEIGNNALLARELGVEPERRFAQIGLGGRLAEPTDVDVFVEWVRGRLGSEPLVFAEGPQQAERVAINSGKSGNDLVLAATEGYDLFLTGEPEEGSLHTARELEVNFVAAGHYATERLGIQALAARLAERFGLDWEFVELRNPV
jgi:dinuclear metal center YbgI/SA1388 family protein